MSHSLGAAFPHREFGACGEVLRSFWDEQLNCRSKGIRYLVEVKIPGRHDLTTTGFITVGERFQAQRWPGMPTPNLEESVFGIFRARPRPRMNVQDLQ